MGDDVDGEALERYVEWVEEGRAQPKVYETPLGTKFSADHNPGGGPSDIGRPEVESFRAVMHRWEDVFVSLYEGDIDAVESVSDEWWEEFVVVASETERVDFDEEELRAARGE